MKKRKGYTLIEILAVIVILALIALIATPIVMNLIGKAKQKAAIDSAYTYVNSINRNNELAELGSDFSSDNEKYADTFYPNLVAFSNLPIKGTLPTDGEVDINNSKVETANLCINGYWVTYGDNKMNISGSCKADRTELESSTVILGVSDNNCSKRKVVTITYPNVEGTYKQYRINSGQWENYSEPIVVNENMTISARLTDGLRETTPTPSLTITTIDKEAISNVSPSLSRNAQNPTSKIEATLRQNDACGINTSTIRYGISETEEGEYRYQTSPLFEGLVNGKTYYFKTKANDIANNGEVESLVNNISTGDYGTVTIGVNPSDWSTSKTITVTGTTTGADLQYKVTNTGGTVTKDWTTITSGGTFTIDEPSTISARLYDGTNVKEPVTSTVTKIDTTDPELTLGTASSTTSTITVPITKNKDDQSSIKSTTCVYGLTTSYGSNGTVNNNQCTMTGLTDGKTYYYKVTTINGANTQTYVTGNKGTGNYGTVTIEQSPDANTWAASKTITVTGTTTGANLQYKVTNTGGTVTKDWTTITSGGTFTIDEPSTISARLYDGTNVKEPVTSTVTKIDTTEPTSASFTYTKSGNSITITASGTDRQSGINGYRFYTSTDNGSTWTRTSIYPSNTYTFTTSSSVLVKVRIYNPVGLYKDSEEQTLSTLTGPIISWSACTSAHYDEFNAEIIGDGQVTLISYICEPYDQYDPTPTLTLLYENYYKATYFSYYWQPTCTISVSDRNGTTTQTKYLMAEHSCN